MSKSEKSQSAKQEAIERLREWLKPGDTVFTILRHVSRSGMQREISPVIVAPGDSKRDGLRPYAPVDIGWLVALALGDRIGKTGGIVIGGCGMNMGFSLVHSLSYALYSSGFDCIGEGCPSSDHSNGDRDYTPHYDGTPRTSEEVGKDLIAYRHWHKEGGYALRQRWI